MGCGASRIGAQPDKPSAKAPPPSFAALIAAGTVVPDEHDGPYALGSYHPLISPRTSDVRESFVFEIEY